MKKGDKIEINFHAYGLISKQLETICEVTNSYIQIDAEDEKYKYKFCRKTGKCLNDNTFNGSKRTIDLNNL